MMERTDDKIIFSLNKEIVKFSTKAKKSLIQIEVDRLLNMPDQKRIGKKLIFKGAVRIAKVQKPKPEVYISARNVH